ncbi:F0F1 ATP synthase subunit alpha [Candidatus Comchoanobacter bicostacola]|uniref:ATP synthase subunit alpha n=1 Tax=Candidatus Comchoanobacter bicostacola TaxID=2919598 RepID=A0ABY5DLB1_9GAMM|nr:F0F1 ATP synthase subunit alpha [Candidatus Comchoanobacter bicostacola]UTC25004.1 F0F1 ATP synthase subunit alpha [Candidatus Comchoanobacter bicostacola]
MKISELSSVIEAKINNLDLDAKLNDQGVVLQVSNGIATIYGLSKAMYGEMLKFENNVMGVVLNLKTDSIGAIIFGDYTQIKEGQSVRATGEILQVPVGTELTGRVINALGQPIDGKGPIKTKDSYPVERIAPGVIARKSVDEPMQTGLKAIDAMTPIGRGQRELIIGDRQTGKTTIAVDTIINQKNASKPMHCIYVAIGQKASTVASIVKKLEDHGAMAYTTVVAANAADPAAMQYIAPYSGCAMGEYYLENGLDALIVYDDLSKHAVAYRQISLLLRRPPGREAFPGDIFYLHSRLLERSARVNESYVEKATQGKVKGKTGSLTALPIIETQSGDCSAFIPTNVISITDGQIFLDEALFKSGIRPAVNSGLSVSRIGGAAQTDIIKKLGGKSRITLAQYRELESFAQFSSDLDESTQMQLHQGLMLTEAFKQHQYQPLRVAEMAVILHAASINVLLDVPTSDMKNYEESLRQYLNNHHTELMNTINATGNYNDTIKTQLTEAIQSFHQSSQWGHDG